jgi:hypothetical protein
MKCDAIEEMKDIKGIKEIFLISLISCFIRRLDRAQR